MSHPTPDRFTIDDLLTAYLRIHRIPEVHRDAATWESRRYHALAAAFGCDLRVSPKEPLGSYPSWQRNEGYPVKTRRSDGRSLWCAFRSALRYHAAVPGIWVSLEGPNAMTPYQYYYGRQVRPVGDALRDIYRTMALDLMSHIWGLAPEATVTRDAVVSAGFDPDEPEPESADWWT